MAAIAPVEMAATWVADNDLICADVMSAICVLVTVEKSYDLIVFIDAVLKSMVAITKLQPPLGIKVKCSLIDTREKYFSEIF